MSDKVVLDACCGSRMFWFDKQNPNVLYCDIRQESHTLCDGRSLVIEPDIVQDYTNMVLADETFYHVVFDPSHLKNIGDNSYMALKYGKLTGDWRTSLKKGFDECMRVLKPNGTLIFKWNEDQIKVNEILTLFDYKPLYGHKSGKHSKTHWIAFMKFNQPKP